MDQAHVSLLGKLALHFPPGSGRCEVRAGARLSGRFEALALVEGKWETLGVDSPFFSTIVLWKRRIPGKNGEGTPTKNYP